jgi:hypothetical protein
LITPENVITGSAVALIEPRRKTSERPAHPTRTCSLSIAAKPVRWDRNVSHEFVGAPVRAGALAPRSPHIQDR